MIKALLLDFNGVVIDDEPIQMRAYQEILAAEGITLSDEDYYASLGMDDITFINTAYARAGKTPETNKVLEISLAKTAKWRDIISGGIPLFPGMENFIRKMSQSFAVGIVSMAKRDEIVHVLETAGLTDAVSVIVSAEDVDACKPDPQCYREGFRRIDLARVNAGHLPMTHDECLVIEDTPPGVAAGKGAGLPVLGVSNTVSDEELRAAGADWVADNLNDWMASSIRRVFA